MHCLQDDKPHKEVCMNPKVNLLVLALVGAGCAALGIYLTSLIFA
ncbi:hypothetical protein JCM19232_4434 [Vibrio ishigakensis]|uniref:Uncharacterized protein n=1 Tax=Vibrio ishigakensis TaxID=1481914 RepID=A0A0B8PJ80_9VIBR|nr:hypothetical protein JCM19232_4434 [Vibrio ishigakensis]